MPSIKQSCSPIFPKAVVLGALACFLGVGDAASLAQPADGSSDGGIIQFNAKGFSGGAPHSWVRIKGTFHGQPINEVFDFQPRVDGVWSIVLMSTLGTSAGSGETGNSGYNGEETLSLDAPVNDKQFDQIMAKAKAWQTGPQVYDIVARNCVSFTADIAETAELKAPSSWSTTPQYWVYLLQGMNPQYLHEGGHPVSYDQAIKAIRSRMSHGPQLPAQQPDRVKYEQGLPSFLRNGIAQQREATSVRAKVTEDTRSAEFTKNAAYNAMINNGIAAQYAYESQQAAQFAQSLGVGGGGSYVNGGGAAAPGAGTPQVDPLCVTFACLIHSVDFKSPAPRAAYTPQARTLTFKKKAGSQGQATANTAPIPAVAITEDKVRADLGIPVARPILSSTLISTHGSNGFASRSAFVIVDAGPQVVGDQLAFQLDDAFDRQGFTIANVGDLSITIGSDPATALTVAPAASRPLPGSSTTIGIKQSIQAPSDQKQHLIMFEVKKGNTIVQVVAVSYDAYTQPDVSISLTRSFMSGIGTGWSPAYHMCTGPAPEGFQIKAATPHAVLQSSSWTKSDSVAVDPRGDACVYPQFQGSAGNWHRRDKPVQGSATLSATYSLWRHEPFLAADDNPIFDTARSNRLPYVLLCQTYFAQHGDRSPETATRCAQPLDFVELPTN